MRKKFRNKAMAAKVREHLAADADMHEMLAAEGPRLIKWLCVSADGPDISLREVGRRLGVSPTYMSMVLNRQECCSPRVYLLLSDLAEKLRCQEK